MILLTIEADVCVLALLAAEALVCVEIIISHRARRGGFGGLNIDLLSVIVAHENCSSDEKIEVTLILRFLCQ